MTTQLDKSLILMAIILICFWGCKNEVSLELIQQSDLSEKFTVGSPKNWHVEKENSERHSTIIASDTSQTIKETILVHLTWNDWEIFLNDHFESSMDSINKNGGFQTSNQKFYTLNSFDIYEYSAKGIDSLNNLNLRTRNFFLRKDGLDGSLNLNISAHNREFDRQDSLLINRILGSIKGK
ncbi:hypothetical protein LV716_13835 [Flagellimonas sp. HMM57]|uniref:hypothetical protein n=1 Tax=unclassified Flagellimonas TaxID=2644544 RepID=UPI0013D4C403|nr:MULTISPECIES: hypothetical protein [unclassified Flagellimonas]UII75328.1 hypothetical protein LV716_13835 [Flagellimonas sp. HMM57]